MVLFSNIYNLSELLTSMKKIGQINLPVIVISVLAVITLSLLLFTLFVYYQGNHDDPKKLANFTRMEQIDDSVKHNVSLTINQPTCQDECSARGLKRCARDGYKICGNFDSDPCYEWSSVYSCGTKEECSSGKCITIQPIQPIENTSAENNTPSTDSPSSNLSLSSSFIRYDFDDIQLLSVEQFNITKNRNESSTWADAISGNSNNLKVTHAIFNLKKEGQILINGEEYLSINGSNGEKRFLYNSGFNSFNQEGILVSSNKQFWSAKQLVEDSIIKNKTLPVYSVNLLEKYSTNEGITFRLLLFSDDGLNINLENQEYNWYESIPDFTSNPEGDPNQNNSLICADSSSWLKEVSPTWAFTNFPIEIYIKGGSKQITPNINISIYSENNSYVKSVSLINQNSLNSSLPDYKSSGQFSLSNSGRYYVHVCSTNLTFNLIDPKITELHPGYNNINADRINLLIFGVGYSSIEELKEIVNKVFAFDGNFTKYNITTIVKDSNNNVVDNTIDQRKQVGFFAIEPLKSNKNKFNIWYVDNPLNVSSQDLINFFNSIMKNGSINNLKYVSPALIYANRDYNSDRSSSGLPNFDNKKIINKESTIFGYSLNYYPVLKNSSNKKDSGVTIETIFEGINTERYTTLAHESGHSLFGLHDEYSEAGALIPYLSYPNCANNLSEAQNWWGNLMGQVDPFYYDYKKFMDEKPNESEIAIGFNFGGCFGPDDGKNVVRPTINSIMRNDYEIPVFGSVNRQRVEQILNLFSGN